jgi:DNA-binding transcriptional MerR regulator
LVEIRTSPEETPMPAQLLTTEEVAERFRTSPVTVRYWRQMGAGPRGVRVGRRILYDEQECDRWYQAQIDRKAGATSV